MCMLTGHMMLLRRWSNVIDADSRVRMTGCEPIFVVDDFNLQHQPAQ